MGKQINLTIPDELMQRAIVFAGCSGRPVADVLTDAIEVSLGAVALPASDDGPAADWSDDQVLAAADSAMPAQDDRRLSELLDQQQAGSLADAERNELQPLMRSYQAGLLRKAHGVAEAVHRGLRPAPLP